jgi:RluA family pseudouridine synthase
MKLRSLQEIIIYEDDNFIIINKPPYIPSLDERFIESTNILQLAREYNPDARVGHRLDRETSGVMALTKNDEAYRHLSIQFERRKTEKIYHAIANGVHKFENHKVDAPLIKKETAIAHIDREEGKEAITYFTTLKAFQKHTLLECRPVTGRMHQIRIHAAYTKAPLVADELYHGKNVYLSSLKKNYNMSQKEEMEQPIIKRFALHAYNLKFENLNGEQMSFTAEYPKDFAVLLKLLEKHS